MPELAHSLETHGEHIRSIRLESASWGIEHRDGANELSSWVYAGGWYCCAETRGGYRCSEIPGGYAQQAGCQTAARKGLLLPARGVLQQSSAI